MKRSPAGRPGERWVILSQYYRPEPGAPQIRLAMLARKLHEHGIQVRVVTGMPNYPTGIVHQGYRGKLFHKEVIDGIEVRRVWLFAATGRNPIIRLCNYLSFSLTATFFVLFCMPRIDVLFIESQPMSLGIAGILLKWLRGVPYVYNIPDIQTDVARELSFVGGGLVRMAQAMEDFFMRQALTVSTVTRRFIDYYAARGIDRRKLSFLPNGADTTALKPLPYDQEYAEKMGVAGKKVFTYVGTHAYYHGLEVLIEVARLLRERMDIVILLVGGGPIRDQLEQMVQRESLTNIAFGPSHFPFEEMPNLMSITWAALVVVKDIPIAFRMRLAKTFPPLACGVPVIYSGRGESADLLLDHQCGLQTPPESPTEFAAAIEQLAADSGLREEMGVNGLRLIRREFTWAGIIENWLNELREGEA